MAQPTTLNSQNILNGMLGIIQRLVTAPERDGDRMDEYLARISRLPAVKSVLEEEDSEADGRESEMYIYFKGVAILLREMMEKMRHEDDAKLFVEGIRKIHQEIFPVGEAKNHTFESDPGETTTGQASGSSLQPSQSSSHVETAHGSITPGCDGLPRITQRQLDEELAKLRVVGSRASQNKDNSPAASNGDELILTGVRSINSKRPLADGAILPQHGKWPRLAGPPTYWYGSTIEDSYSNALTQKRNLYSSRQPNTDGWLIWRLVKDAALKRPVLNPSRLASTNPASRKNRQMGTGMEKSIDDAINTLKQILGNEGIEQIRALEKEYTPLGSRTFQSSPQMIPWQSLFQVPIAGDVRSLALCVKHYSAQKTALDGFGENLARAELYRVCSSEAGSSLSLSSVEGVEPGKGKQLYILACAFGVGILALVPSLLRVSLQNVRPHALKHIIASIRESKAHELYAKIEDVSRGAKVVALAAVEGISVDFQLAAEDVVEILEDFYQ